VGLNAFTKTGNTVTFVANTSAPTPVQCLSTTLGGNQYRVINTGTITVFLGYGTTSAEATNNAVVVTSSQTSFPLLPSTDEILTFVPNAYFTAISSSGTATIYITPGDGL
jgi:Na+/phosphate symporter